MSARGRKPRDRPPDPLYHFTCEHGFEGISKTGILLPRIHPFMRRLGPLLWLSDQPAPSADSVGLTSERLTCDRLTYRYIVHTRAAVRWTDLRGCVPRAFVDVLEAFGEPVHWWVVRRTLLASEFVLDGAYINPAQNEDQNEDQNEEVRA